MNKCEFNYFSIVFVVAMLIDFDKIFIIFDLLINIINFGNIA